MDPQATKSGTTGNDSCTQNKKSQPAKNQTKITVRSQRDVLCGRGVPIGKHYGNILLHTAINKYREKYLDSPRTDKPVIIRQIVQEIKAAGARFLKRLEPDGDDEIWVEVDDNYAYRKVGHAIRSRKTCKALRVANPQVGNPATQAPFLASSPFITNPLPLTAMHHPIHISANLSEQLPTRPAGAFANARLNGPGVIAPQGHAATTIQAQGLDGIAIPAHIASRTAATSRSHLQDRKPSPQRASEQDSAEG